MKKTKEQKMIRTRKISCVAASALLMLAVAVSCSKEGNGGGRNAAEDGRITLRALVCGVSPYGLKGTKAITEPTKDDSTLRTDYSVYTSAYYTDKEFPSTDGNFFTGVRFYHDGLIWNTTTPIYWPADTGGNGIDFLAVATDSTVFKMSELATWAGQEGFLHGEKNVHGVRIRVPYSNDDTEILYATASQMCDDKNSVEMNFRHTQCCLEFHIHSNLDSILKINKIYVNEAYSTGELTILTHPLESVTWNLEGAEPHAGAVPGVVDATPVKKDNILNYSVVLPPQERRDIVFSFRQIASLDDILGMGNLDLIWQGLSIEVEYTTTTEAKKWEAGKKYIFDVTIKFGEIIIVPTVAEWTDGDDIIIPV